MVEGVQEISGPQRRGGQEARPSSRKKPQVKPSYTPHDRSRPEESDQYVTPKELEAMREEVRAQQGQPAKQMDAQSTSPKSQEYTIGHEINLTTSIADNDKEFHTFTVESINDHGKPTLKEKPQLSDSYKKKRLALHSGTRRHDIIKDIGTVGKCDLTEYEVMEKDSVGIFTKRFALPSARERESKKIKNTLATRKKVLNILWDVKIDCSIDGKKCKKFGDIIKIAMKGKDPVQASRNINKWLDERVTGKRTDSTVADVAGGVAGGGFNIAGQGANMYINGLVNDAIGDAIGSDFFSAVGEFQQDFGEIGAVVGTALMGLGVMGVAIPKAYNQHRAKKKIREDFKTYPKKVSDLAAQFKALPRRDSRK